MRILGLTSMLNFIHSWATELFFFKILAKKN